MTNNMMTVVHFVITYIAFAILKVSAIVHFVVDTQRFTVTFSRVVKNPDYRFVMGNTRQYDVNWKGSF